jgi:hypothetical protein
MFNPDFTAVSFLQGKKQKHPSYGNSSRDFQECGPKGKAKL